MLLLEGLTQHTIDFVKSNVAAMRWNGSWRYGYAEPHEYVPTEPYHGCGKCGIGPGAFHHNEFFVRDYWRVKGADLL